MPVWKKSRGPGDLALRGEALSVRTESVQRAARGEPQSRTSASGLVLHAVSPLDPRLRGPLLSVGALFRRAERECLDAAPSGPTGALSERYTSGIAAPRMRLRLPAIVPGPNSQPQRHKIWFSAGGRTARCAAPTAYPEVIFSFCRGRTLAATRSSPGALARQRQAQFWNLSNSIFSPAQAPVGPDETAPKHSWFCAPEGPYNVQRVTPVMGGRGPTPLVKGRWPKARGDREGEYEREALILSRPPVILKVNCPEGAREGGLGHWVLSHRWESTSPPRRRNLPAPDETLSLLSPHPPQGDQGFFLFLRSSSTS